MTPPPSLPRPPVVLASGSPRRRLLLEAIGATFTVRAADVDETPRPDEDPVAMVLRLAAAKARAVPASVPEGVVIAADTAVVVDGRSLGKPRDVEENRRFLRILSGRPHRVVTGHHLMLGDRETSEAVETRVTLRTLHDREIERFTSRGEGLDKAGGYAIQDVGAALVGHVDGCYTNVVGLSVPAVLAAAERLGVALV